VLLRQCQVCVHAPSHKHTCTTQSWQQ
jgi:hypothetical protein